MEAAIDMAYTRHYPTNGEKPRCHVILLHGLMGNGATMRHLVGPLTSRGAVVSVAEWRNHGQSPATSTHSVATMAADLRRFLSMHAAPIGAAIPVILAGHSMGGVALMDVVIHRGDTGDRGAMGEYGRIPKDVADIVSGIVVLDIAPTTRPPSAASLVTAIVRLAEMPLTTVTSIQDAWRWVEEHPPTCQFARENPRFMAYLLKQLQLSGDPTTARWECNIKVIARDVAKGLTAWRAGEDDVVVFSRPALFMFGGASPYYMNPNAIPAVNRYFPQAKIEVLNGEDHFFPVRRCYADHVASSMMALIERVLPRAKL